MLNKQTEAINNIIIRIIPSNFSVWTCWFVNYPNYLQQFFWKSVQVDKASLTNTESSNSQITGIPSIQTAQY